MTDIALHKITQSSSQEGPEFNPQNATDGNPKTRWSSNFNDEEWLQVDLGGIYLINKVRIAWEAAYATFYDVELSSYGDIFETVASVDEGEGSTEELSFEGKGRYVRINCKKRATAYGYSIFNFEVFGKEIHSYKLFVEIDGPGKVSVDPPGYLYEKGQKVKVRAIPLEDSKFNRWGGNLEGKVLIREIVMDNHNAVLANFKPCLMFNLHTIVSGFGNIKIEPQLPKYDIDSIVSLTAVPRDGYKFLEWRGDIKGSKPDRNIEMDANKIIFAVFVPI